MSRIDYLLVYPDLRKRENEPSGGCVEMHITHASHEAARNIETAIVLAKQGFKVRLLPIDNTPHIKNPDAYFIEQDIVIEFKHNYTPTASAIEREVRNAKKQADHILIHAMSGITRDELIQGLRQHLHRAENIITVWLIFDGIIYHFSPEEIRNKHIEDKMQ
ncbi:hypothetical protein GO755_16150 [Spirosoma sp. HMF4905]|uniref:tRNA nuclease CdiA C-terminal domain-containing protein n=1 Tax=Spirosoma arboris TaxID=2682092 RepID=A0A7K1SCR7_9BACT|nr:hypothetical protein [Spirosoma arboris]MVM31580.1 hypothetical protein [Spirosoma arboris]